VFLLARVLPSVPTNKNEHVPVGRLSDSMTNDPDRNLVQFFE